MSDTLPYTMIDGIKCYSPEVASAYTDYPDSGFDLTDANADSSFWVTSRIRLFRYLIERAMATTGKTRLLEIGCGTGDFIRKICDLKNLEITGSEVYLKGLVYAKRNLPGVEFVQFDATKGKIGDHFDIISAFDVIEHIDDDTTALANMGEMLTPGGTLIISVPQHRFLWSTLDDIVKHKRRYSRAELVGKIRGAGFDVTYATSHVVTLFPLMLISRLLDRGCNAEAPSDEAALEARVKFSGFLNWIFGFFMRFDEVLIRAGVSLRFGGTLVVVARKR